jgi:dissimilatory sulfite reductase (desulfoviridin) alpha/beta subunit
MNVNGSYPSLKETKIPEEFLSKVYLARCSFDYDKGCSSPEGQISDFNIWDRALSEKEATDWTSCRQAFLNAFCKMHSVTWSTGGRVKYIPKI